MMRTDVTIKHPARLWQMFTVRRVIVALVLLGQLTGAGPLTVKPVVVRTVSAAPVYPVKVGPTGRYLVDQN